MLACFDFKQCIYVGKDINCGEAKILGNINQANCCDASNEFIRQNKYTLLSFRQTKIKT